MFPNVFKSSKSIDFDKLMKNYIIKNYDSASYSQEVQVFISEFQQNRNVVILLNEKEKTYDALKNTKDVLVQYLSMLNVIKSKMNFGKDDFSIKVEFGWKDVLKNDFWYSYNVNHEYYSNLYNLATLYFCLGQSILYTDEDDNRLKEAIKYYQYSSYLFDNIKNELPSVIPPKETPPDMTQNYLTYCSYICLAHAQAYLLKVAERKKSSFELQGQLSKGIFDLFTSAFQLANESLKKFLSDEARALINNRRFWFVAQSFIKMKDQVLDDFSKTGEGYGRAIAYLGLACDSLNNGYKDIKKVKNLIDVKAYEDFKTSQELLGQEMLDKNSRIYYQAVPDLTTLPKLDKKIMVNPQAPPENLNVMLEGNNAILDALVPKEVKGMIENYKRNMMEYISENLNNYQSEAEIVAFLAELNLPYSLETVLSQNEVSESLWKKINEVQQKGGSMFMMNNITNLEKKGEEISRRINDMMLIITNEEDEDNKYRRQYGDRWNRNPSSQLNYQYLSVLQEYSKKLEIAKKCDAQVKEGITDNMKYFELLSLSKQALSNKIPVKTDPNAIQNCEEAAALRKDLDSMDSLKDKCMEIINKIFQTLNEDNIIPQFIKVLQKKTTEKAILTDNKPKYDAMFKELGAISDEIKLLKLSIVAKNEVFIRVKQSNFKTNEDNEKFFRDLENYCQLYNQKLINLQQGMNFYVEFNRRLNDINGHITDYLVSRDMEKSDLLKFITSGGSTGFQYKGGNSNTNPNNNNMFYGNNNNNYWDFTNTNSMKKYLNQSDYLDANKNLVTNLGVGNSNQNYNMNTGSGWGNNPSNSNSSWGSNVNTNTNMNTNWNNNQNTNSNMININPNNNLYNPNPGFNNQQGFSNDFNNMNINSNTNYNNNQYGTGTKKFTNTDPGYFK